MYVLPLRMGNIGSATLCLRNNHQGSPKDARCHPLGLSENLILRLVFSRSQDPPIVVACEETSALFWASLGPVYTYDAERRGVR